MQAQDAHKMNLFRALHSTQTIFMSPLSHCLPLSLPPLFNLCLPLSLSHTFLPLSFYFFSLPLSLTPSLSPLRIPSLYLSPLSLSFSPSLSFPLLLFLTHTPSIRRLVKYPFVRQLVDIAAKRRKKVGTSIFEIVSFLKIAQKLIDNWSVRSFGPNAESYETTRQKNFCFLKKKESFENLKYFDVYCRSCRLHFRKTPSRVAKQNKREKIDISNDHRCCCCCCCW